LALPEGVDTIWVALAACHQEEHQTHQEDKRDVDGPSDSGRDPAVGLNGAGIATGEDIGPSGNGRFDISIVIVRVLLVSGNAISDTIRVLFNKILKAEIFGKAIVISV